MNFSLLQFDFIFSDKLHHRWRCAVQRARARMGPFQFCILLFHHLNHNRFRRLRASNRQPRCHWKRRLSFVFAFRHRIVSHEFQSGSRRGH